MGYSIIHSERSIPAWGPDLYDVTDIANKKTRDFIWRIQTHSKLKSQIDLTRLPKIEVALNDVPWHCASPCLLIMAIITSGASLPSDHLLTHRDLESQTPDESSSDPSWPREVSLGLLRKWRNWRACECLFVGACGGRIFSAYALKEQLFVLHFVKVTKHPRNPKESSVTSASLSLSLPPYLGLKWYTSSCCTHQTGDYIGKQIKGTEISYILLLDDKALGSSIYLVYAKGA